MPRYSYDKLEVSCLHPVHFKPTELRAAVQCLKSLPDPHSGFIGLMAIASVTAGQYKLLARALLPLREIEGRTPREVWELFDAEVDADRRGLMYGQDSFQFP